MTYTLIVAVELNPRYKKKKILEKHLQIQVEENERETVSSKLFGASVNQSSLVKKVWEKSEWTPDLTFPKWDSEHVEKITGFEVIGGVVILLLQFRLDQPGKAANYKRLSSTHLRRVLAKINAVDYLSTASTVYPVMGSLAPVDDSWLLLTKDGWLHIQGGYQHEKVLSELVAQVAIEKYLLTWATSPVKGLRNLFHAPYAAAVVRRWRVQLLSDWEEITVSYGRLRESLNLPGVRAEVLERGKNWWTLMTAWSSAISILGALAAVISKA